MQVQQQEQDSRIAISDAFKSSGIQTVSCEGEQSPLLSLSRASCVLSSRCPFTPKNARELVEHLTSAHGIVEHLIESSSETSKGSIEMEIMVPVSLQPVASTSKTRRFSSIVLHFDGQLFLWSLESKVRADTEVQVSTTVQFINTNPTTPSSSSFWDDLHTPPSDRSPSSSSSTSIWDRSPRNNTGSAAATSGSSSPRQKYCANIVIGKGQTTSWKTVIDPLQSAFPTRHERVISFGKGAVVLYPSNQELFGDIVQNEKDASVSLTVIVELSKC